MLVRANRLLLPTTLLLASASPVTAQTVHHVGPGNILQIGAAVAFASPGDIIEVATGNYRAFTCDKAVTIVAEPGAQVEVYPDFGFGVPPTLFQLPAGQVARVRGLHFHSISFIQISEVHVLSGTVAFEECRWTGALTMAQTLLVQNAACWLRDCELVVGATAFANPAVRAISAQVAAVDCLMQGSDLLPDGSFGAGAGVDATNSAVHLTRCTVSGGVTYIFSCFYPAGDAVRTDRGDWTWISDSSLQGGNAFCALGGGGAALRNTSTTAVKLSRNTLVGGTGGASVNVVVGPTAPGQLVGLAAAAPQPLLGAPYLVDYLAEPNETLFVFASLDLQPLLPSVSQEATWLPVNGYVCVAALPADSAGLATFTTNVPNAPSLKHQGIWLHAAALTSGPWRVSAPLGGVLR